MNIKTIIAALVIVLLASCGKEYSNLPSPDLTGYKAINMGVWHEAGAPLSTDFYVSIGEDGPYTHVTQQQVDNWNGYDFQYYPSHTLYVPASIYSKYISQ